MADSIGFLISDVSRLMRRRFDEMARSIGVTRPQWRALSAIGRNEGVNQGRLAELLEVEPITLCRMVDRLEEAGHVERRRDPADRRAWRIHLTDRARPTIDELRVLADALFARALAGVDAAAVDALRQSLERIHANLCDPVEAKEVAHG